MTKMLLIHYWRNYQIVVKNIQKKESEIVEIINVEEPLIAVRVSQYPEDKKSEFLILAKFFLLIIVFMIGYFALDISSYPTFSCDDLPVFAEYERIVDVALEILHVYPPLYYICVF